MKARVRIVPVSDNGGESGCPVLVEVETETVEDAKWEAIDACRRIPTRLELNLPLRVTVETDAGSFGSRLGSFPCEEPPSSP